MAHGTPDWAEVAPKTTVYGGIDLAEHAVRIGSIVSFDGRGSVVWADDFESGIHKWDEIGSGDGHDAEWSAVYARNGGFSCKITPGADGNFLGGIRTYLPPLTLGKVGLEVSWVRPTTFTDFSIFFYHVHPTKGWRSGIKFVDATATLQYYDSSLAWQDIEAGVGARASGYLFNILKLVIDLENDLYTRLIFNNREWDLSPYGLYTNGGSAVTEALIEVQLVVPSAFGTPSYIDDVIVTQNEP